MTYAARADHEPSVYRTHAAETQGCCAVKRCRAMHRFGDFSAPSQSLATHGRLAAVRHHHVSTGLNAALAETAHSSKLFLRTRLSQRLRQFHVDCIVEVKSLGPQAALK